MTTVDAYRLCSPRWARSAFTGEGARRFGGRWNPPGVPLVYLSGSRALGALELLVHLTTPRSRLVPYTRFCVEIPADAIDELDPGRLPEGWRESPPGPATQALGRDWVEEGNLALSVPSALIPEERNLLLNPRHSRFPEVGVGSPRAFHFDPRLAG